MKYVSINGYVMGYKGRDLSKRLSNAVVYTLLRIGNQRFNINYKEHLEYLEKNYPMIFRGLVLLSRHVEKDKTAIEKIKWLFSNKYKKVKTNLQTIFPDKQVNEIGDFSLTLPVLNWNYEILAKVEGSHGVSRVISVEEMSIRDNIMVEVGMQDPTLPKVPPPRPEDMVQHTPEEIQEVLDLE